MDYLNLMKRCQKERKVETAVMLAAKHCRASILNTNYGLEEGKKAREIW
ncbi:MAG: hypothetical protein PV340_01150 [Wolbachia sp.]|nr:hypothetical protein [Wolbachia sp.]MDD9336381.1 hypothetical protein [Wolbachia sp.]